MSTSPADDIGEEKMSGQLEYPHLINFPILHNESTSDSLDNENISKSLVHFLDSSHHNLMYQWYTTLILFVKLVHTASWVKKRWFLSFTNLVTDLS